MRIDEVLNIAIVEIYRAPLAGQKLFLKGGSAKRLFDKTTSRLSTDADFSIEGSLQDVEKFFQEIEEALCSGFGKLKYELIDFQYRKRPSEKRRDRPEWWGGWLCEFKLVSLEHKAASHEQKRRLALKPPGSTSPIITIEISEHEYCGHSRTKIINGVKVRGYSRELIVLEKIRAICQQHPQYKYRLARNRARDFFDIYELTREASDLFKERCRRHVENVFKAKEVSLSILKAFDDEEFINDQRRGFEEVKDTVTGQVHDFSVYVEHLRFFLHDIFPESKDAGGAS